MAEILALENKAAQAERLARAILNEGVTEALLTLAHECREKAKELRSKRS